MIDSASLTFLALEWCWLLLGTACALAAAFIVLSKRGLTAWRLRVESTAAGRKHRASMLFFGVLIPWMLTAYKFAQFNTFQLMMDSATAANGVWNFAHGHGPTTSLYSEKSLWAIHFAFTVFLLSPFIRLWESISVLILAQGLIVSSAVWGAYLLGTQVGKSRTTGILLALLTLSNPLFHGLTTIYLDNGPYALPFFIWAAYCHERKNTPLASILIVLLLTTSERAPFVLLGIGAYLLVRANGNRGRLAAAGLMLGSIVVWSGEMAFIHHSRGNTPVFYDHWALYANLGSSPGNILRNAFLRPWIFIGALFYPPAKIIPVVENLAALGLLPLLSGWAVLPVVFIWTAHQLAVPGAYQGLAEHYSAFVAGPLIFSSAYGLARLYRGTDNAKKLVLGGLLLVSGVNFFLNSNFRPPEGSMPRAWRTAVPRAAAVIPPNAKLWCDEYLTPHFAMRQYIRSLPFSRNASFEEGLFLPDRVLLSEYWVGRAEPRYRDRILGFLERRGFVKIFQEADLIVLAPSEEPSGAQQPPEPIELGPRENGTP